MIWLLLLVLIHTDGTKDAQVTVTASELACHQQGDNQMASIQRNPPPELAAAVAKCQALPDPTIPATNA